MSQTPARTSMNHSPTPFCSDVHKTESDSVVNGMENNPPPPSVSLSSDHEDALIANEITEKIQPITTSTVEKVLKIRKDVTCGDVCIPQEQKNAASRQIKKYRYRRDKNNLSSKRSRQTRKRKLKDMEQNVHVLEIENAKLRVKNDNASELARHMKDYLITCVKNNLLQNETL